MEIKRKTAWKVLLLHLLFYRYSDLIRLLFFFSGLWVIAAGVVCTINADLGVPPWDVLHIGLHKVTSLSIGFWSIAVGVIIVGTHSLMIKQWPKWGTIANMVMIGIFIDTIIYFQFVPEVSVGWGQVLLLVVGIVLIAMGVGLYIAPQVGAGPRDGLTLELSNRTGWSIRKVRTIMELAVGGIGWLLGGPVHVGTLFFCFLTGPIMQFSIQLCERILDSFLKRGAQFEDIYKRALRAHHHDGFSN